MKQIIDHKKIIIPINYVLIKPDSDFDKYHDSEGNETSIYVGTSARKYEDEYSDENFNEVETNETFAQNFSYSGTVIAIPKKLQYNGREIDRFKREKGEEVFHPENMNKLMQMTDDSVEYDTDIEVQPGDRVFYDYLEKFKLYQDQRSLNTDIGELYLIRYDKLEFRVREGEVFPLNTFIIIDHDVEKEITFGDLTLEVANTKSLHQHTEPQVGTIIKMPTPVRGFKKELNWVDNSNFLKTGDKVLFLPQYAFSIENDNHFVLFHGKEYFRIKSSDILAIKE